MKNEKIVQLLLSWQFRKIKLVVELETVIEYAIKLCVFLFWIGTIFDGRWQ